MCGLFGYIGSEPPNIDKIKILGILNEDRGKHSNGFYYNGEIKKGVDDKKIFTNHIKEILINPIQGANLFIGHTRSATYGEHTEANAHPFLINNRLVIAHNGTIPNAWDLCKEYGINTEGVKVDSIAMGMLIEQEGFKVLNEYKGKAAFIMHFLDEPNSLYIYHGASKEKENGEPIEERPLYYLQKANGMYLSSLGYSLNSIRDEDWEKAELVPHNHVFKITDGKADYDFDWKVERGNINVEKPVTPTSYSDYYTRHSGGHQSTIYYPPANTPATKQLPRQKEKEEKNGNKIWHETPPNKSFEVIHDIVYFYKGRYWKAVNAGSMSQEVICEGKLYLNKQGAICNPDGTAGEPYWFYRGAMMKSYKDYVTVTTDPKIVDKLNTSPNFAAVLSKYSKYPLTNLEDESEILVPELRYAWYRDGRVEKSGFTAKFSDRVHHFDKKGHLSSLTCKNKKEYPLFYNESESQKEQETSSTEDKVTEVGEAMEFFQKKWSNTSDIEQAFTVVPKRALQDFLVDAAEQLENKFLNALEVQQRITALFDDAVLQDASISELLPTTGDLETYIEVAIDKIEKEVKELLKVGSVNQPVNTTTPIPKEISDEYTYRNGVYVSNIQPTKAEEETNNSEGFLINYSEVGCDTCNGLGLVDSYMKCPACEGTGLRVKKETKVFTDVEFEEVDEKVEKQNEEAANLIIDWVIPVIDDLEDAVDELDDLRDSTFASKFKSRVSTFARIIKLGLEKTAVDCDVKRITEALKIAENKQQKTSHI